MREIKFRVWDGQSMYPVEQWVNKSWVAVPVQIGEEEWELQQRKLPESPLMQFTGLKDKNGKEIYEGDVVKKLTRERRKAVQQLGAVIWDDKILGFNLYNQDTYVGMLTWVDNVEIIGNIYENPELLEGDTNASANA